MKSTSSPKHLAGGLPIHSRFVLAFVLVVLVVGLSWTPINAQEIKAQTTVGYPGLIEQLVIEGPKLQAKPIEDRDQPVLVRILETFPHGTMFRYDIEYIGMEPGKFNLGEYLVPVEIQAKDWDPPEIMVEVMAILPPGQVEPSTLVVKDNRFGNYYLALMVLGGVIWLAGLFAILFYGRGRIFQTKLAEKPVTVADRLKPLLQKAVDGEISSAEQAELERVLVAFWRKKLKLESLAADDLRQKLREHDEAGKMLSMIDEWLHAPPSKKRFDIEELVKPYQSLTADEV